MRLEYPGAWCHQTLARRSILPGTILLSVLTGASEGDSQLKASVLPSPPRTVQLFQILMPVLQNKNDLPEKPQKEWNVPGFSKSFCHLQVEGRAEPIQAIHTHI